MILFPIFAIYHYPHSMCYLIGSEVTDEDHIFVYDDVFKRVAEQTQGNIKIAAFNIQVFGITKYSNSEVVDILSRVS